LFKDKYKHLAIRSVWLIEKSKENDGFQVWHRDFWLGHKVMPTIVVNIGAIMRNYLEAIRKNQCREQLESVSLAALRI
jgi:hypothetical protein